jgi:ABC-type lipoprotein export system ATPase subunit
MNTPLIKLQAIRKSYTLGKVDVSALREVSLDIDAGEFVALSGGQRQRVAIARAMVTQPNLVLADEPTANLDSETAGQILDLMSQINQETGTTFLFATHDPRITDRASRQIHLHDGQIVNDLILTETPRRFANAH